MLLCLVRSTEAVSSLSSIKHLLPYIQKVQQTGQRWTRLRDQGRLILLVKSLSISADHLKIKKMLQSAFILFTPEHV